MPINLLPLERAITTWQMDRAYFIEEKLHEITRTICQHIDDKRLEDICGTGLYCGSGGVVLFLSHYFRKYTAKISADIYEKYFYQFIENLTDEPQVSLTYCNGLVGALEALKMMNASSLIELDYSEIEASYDTEMWSWMSYCFANQNYDFLHGALGVAMHFKDNPRYIENTLLRLEETAVKNDGKRKWISRLGQNQPYGYNICLSHGMSGMIIYLSQVYQSGVMAELNKQLLEKAVCYVLSQEIDHTQYGCYFPSQSLENGDFISRSRLAWCYGDLGVAAALWQAGKATANDLWSNKALEVYRFSTGRKDLQNAIVHDAGLCHGTAGIAMMFAYMYRETSDVEFKNARDYWIDQTLDMSRFIDGPAGYKQFIANNGKHVEWKNSYSLLEGIAGIGFMLLSILDVSAEQDLLSSFALY